MKPLIVGSDEVKLPLVINYPYPKKKLAPTGSSTQSVRSICMKVDLSSSILERRRHFAT